MVHVGENTLRSLSIVPLRKITLKDKLRSKVGGVLGCY